MMPRCEVCDARATHVCSGLDAPAVYFCEAHGKAHEADHVCDGTLVRMGEDDPDAVEARAADA